jgi:hypothetical protein
MSLHVAALNLRSRCEDLTARILPARLHQRLAPYPQVPLSPLRIFTAQTQVTAAQFATSAAPLNRTPREIGWPRALVGSL